ncbi:MAG TPA: hypothetical protein ENJ89_11555 [Caldithrix abyssi]|uniref:Uncharacterized protein n=1 Tax=Caldithrix abyssi TaxID=187145 RepID=A0A7V5PRB7_CALAY|nr:hypothetical protein [Caldithrix abyssi]
MAKELKTNEDTLLEWREVLFDDIYNTIGQHIDKILNINKLHHFQKIEYFSALYTRLREELDKRDFSGLPTDKLYYMLINVKDQIAQMTRPPEQNDDYDDWDDSELYDNQEMFEGPDEPDLL